MGSLVPGASPGGPARRGHRLILLLDTYSLLFRAFYALPPMNTSVGAPTSGLYGLSVLLLKLLKEQRPDRLGFAADAGPSFRSQLAPSYKAHRTKTPSDLASQIEVLPSLFAAMKAVAQSVPGFEADDVLATLARIYSNAGEEVLIVTGDRDLFQTIESRVRVLFVGRRGQDHVLYDEAQVQQRYGLVPAQLPDFIALTGDKSDNIPKVPGVGDKTASRWLARFGDIDGVLNNIGGLQPVRLRAVVEAHVDQLRQSAKLARLRTDVALGPEPRTTAPTAEVLAGLKAWFEQWEFASLIARVDAL